jgi:hypothetical protein
MDTEPYLEERAVRFFQRVLPNLTVCPISRPIASKSAVSSETAVSVNLPAAHSADYSFWLHFSPEFQIGAKLVNDPGDRSYFWYLPFELADYKNSAEASEDAFYEILELVLTHETRIIQKDGLILTGFRCEYESNGTWNRVGGLSYVRLTFKLPRIRGRQWTYHSTALADSY